jgi:hypothetical protein
MGDTLRLNLPLTAAIHRFAYSDRNTSTGCFNAARRGNQQDDE